MSFQQPLVILSAPMSFPVPPFLVPPCRSWCLHVVSTASMSFTAPQCRSDRFNVIPSEAEESKTAIGSRGAIHATRHRIESGCSATA